VSSKFGYFLGVLQSLVKQEELPPINFFEGAEDTTTGDIDRMCKSATAHALLSHPKCPNDLAVVSQVLNTSAADIRRGLEGLLNTRTQFLIDQEKRDVEHWYDKDRAAKMALLDDVPHFLLLRTANDLRRRAAMQFNLVEEMRGGDTSSTYKNLFSLVPSAWNISDHQRDVLTAVIGLLMGKFPTVKQAATATLVSDTTITRNLHQYLRQFNWQGQGYFRLEMGSSTKDVKLFLADFSRSNRKGLPELLERPVNTLAEQVLTVEEFLNQFNRGLMIRVKWDLNKPITGIKEPIEGMAADGRLPEWFATNQLRRAIWFASVCAFEGKKVADIGEMLGYKTSDILNDFRYLFTKITERYKDHGLPWIDCNPLGVAYDYAIIVNGKEVAFGTSPTFVLKDFVRTLEECGLNAKRYIQLVHAVVLPTGRAYHASGPVRRYRFS
jgi:hypothetical protein